MMIIRDEQQSIVSFLRKNNISIKRMDIEQVKEPFYMDNSFDDIRYASNWVEDLREKCIDALPEQYIYHVNRYPDHTWSSYYIPVEMTDSNGVEASIFTKEDYKKVMCDNPVTFLVFSLPEFRLSLELVSVVVSEYVEEYVDIYDEYHEEVLPEPTGYTSITYDLVSEVDADAILRAMDTTEVELKKELMEYIISYNICENITYDSLFTYEKMIEDVLAQQVFLTEIDNCMINAGFNPVSIDYRALRIRQVISDSQVIVYPKAYGLKDTYKLVDLKKGTVENVYYVNDNFNSFDRKYTPYQLSEINELTKRIASIYYMDVSSISFEIENRFGYKNGRFYFMVDENSSPSYFVNVDYRKYIPLKEALEKRLFRRVDNCYIIPIDALVTEDVFFEREEREAEN